MNLYLFFQNNKKIIIIFLEQVFIISNEIQGLRRES